MPIHSPTSWLVPVLAALLTVVAPAPATADPAAADLATAARNTEVRDSVVRIEVTSRTPDLARPWSRRSPSRSSGSGVMIHGARILTNAHVVRYASQIEVQPSGSSDRHSATVLAVAPGIDLALLKLDDEGAAEAIPPLEFEPRLPTLKQQVAVLGYPVGGNDLSVTEGVVSRIEYTGYYYNTDGLRIQVDAALNPGNSGGPAVSDDKLVGLVFSGIREADNIGYLIPVEEIEMFLRDVEDGQYDGKPELARGARVVRLENQALRDSLGLRDDITGVLLTEAPASGAENGLRLGDVITHIGPHNIDNQGYVRTDDNLRLRFGYYTDKVLKDGRVPHTVFRDGESMVINVPVNTGNRLVLRSLMHRYPDYFIWGPIVFSTATAELATAGNRKIWELFHRTNSPLLGRLLDRCKTADEEIVVIPNRLFPHRITRGYGPVAMAVVDSVNGEPVRNLKHLVELLRDCTDEFVKVDLGGYYPPLVFRRTEAEAATDEILTDEGIRYRASAALRTVWEAAPVADEPAGTDGVETASAGADAGEASGS